MRTLRLAARRALWAVPVAAMVLAACDENRTTIFDPIGPRAFDFTFGPSGVGLPSGHLGTSGDTITVVTQNLRALTGGNYQFWVASRDSLGADVITAAYGSVVEFTSTPGVDSLGTPISIIDSNVVSPTPTTAYAGTDAAVDSVRFLIDSTANASDPTAANAIFFSIESGTATTASDARFLFRRIGVAGDGDLTFGRFGGTDVVEAITPRDQVYAAVGTGRGGIRGPEISIDVEAVARPPVGFFYRGFVIDTTGAATLVDTLRSAYDPVTSLSRVNLADADVNDLLPGVTADGIRAAQLRNCAAGSNTAGCQNTMTAPTENTFDGFVTVVLVLEPKLAPATMGPAEIFSATIPKPVQ